MPCEFVRFVFFHPVAVHTTSSDLDQTNVSASKALLSPDQSRKMDSKVESDLSPIAAEYWSISACSTQNKAKRANKIVFLLLIRDQEVEGSNPFAPTTSFESTTYKTGKSNVRLVQG